MIAGRRTHSQPHRWAGSAGEQGQSPRCWCPGEVHAMYVHVLVIHQTFIRYKTINYKYTRFTTPCNTKSEKHRVL